MKTWKVAFAGSSANSRDILEAVARQPGFHIPFVITRKDKPKGRGMRQQPTPVGEYAKDNGMQLLQPEGAEQFAAMEQLASCDLLLVVAYGMRIPGAALAKPRRGCVNVHYSVLPRWRGASPVQHAIKNGDERSGISIFKLEEKLDTGPVLYQQECPIEPDDTSGTLLQKLDALACDILPGVLEKILNQEITPLPQQHEQACYAPRITNADTIVDWNQQSASQVDRLVRAMHPRPLARTKIAGINLLLHEVKQVNPGNGAQPASPGEILHNADKSIDVIAADGNGLRLLKVQAEGKKPLPIEEMLNGRPALRHARSV